MINIVMTIVQTISIKNYFTVSASACYLELSPLTPKSNRKILGTHPMVRTNDVHLDFWPTSIFFIFNIFILFHNANIVHFSSIKNFNKHVQIDNFHFKCETRIKEKFFNSVYKKSQSCQIISLACSVIIQQFQN